ncbi:hypothetical protein AQ611_08845 [Burkholderia singularis]|nr:hypothetical protein AQ611_08845 [Burkholderia sp. Bp7605]
MRRRRYGIIGVTGAGRLGAYVTGQAALFFTAYQWSSACLPMRNMKRGPLYAGLVQSAIAFLCLSGRAEPVPRASLWCDDDRRTRTVSDAPAERADHARRGEQRDNPFLHFMLPFSVIEEEAVRPVR